MELKAKVASASALCLGRFTYRPKAYAAFVVVPLFNITVMIMKNKTTRRQFATAGVVLAATTVCGATPALDGGVLLASQSTQEDDKDTPSEGREDAPETSAHAIERLTSGNARFVSGKLRHPHSANEWRKRLIDGQAPFATILGCSDSRVPPELLFDQGFGDLFVIRVAGNVVDTDVVGSIEYGVDHLKTKLVVVMGHEGCGAVTAALQADSDLEKEPNEIRSLVSKIKPATKEVSKNLPFGQRLNLSVAENVRKSVKQLKAISDLAAAEKESRTQIIGCVYEIKTGRVRTLDM